MIMKRSVFGSATVADKTARDTTTPVFPVARASSQATDVSRIRLGHSRSDSGGGAAPRGSFNLFLGSRKVSLSDHNHHRQDSDYLSAFIGVGFVGAIILTAVGCVIFQYCKNGRRSSSPQANRRRRNVNATVVSSPLQDAHAMEERGEVGQDSESLVLRVRSEADEASSDDDEMSWLNANFREDEPIQYCIVPVQPEHKAPAENTSPSVSAENPLKDISVALEWQGEVVELKNMDSESRHNIDNGSPPETAETNLNVGIDCQSIGVGYDNDREYHSPAVPTNSNDDMDLSPLTEGISDTSDLLEALALDVSCEKNRDIIDDVTKDEEDTSCRESNEDSADSEESFSRLQGVTAQADFSPYHLAWSTPPVQHRHAMQRHPSTTPKGSTCAKKLTMETAPDKRDPSREAYTDPEHGEHNTASDTYLVRRNRPENGTYLVDRRRDRPENGTYLVDKRTNRPEDGTYLVDKRRNRPENSTYLVHRRGNKAPNPGDLHESETYLVVDQSKQKPELQEVKSLQAEADSSVRTMKSWELSQTEHSSYSTRRISESSRGSKMSDSSLLRRWGFLNPWVDTSGRPVSIELGSERPSGGQQRRSLGSWSDAGEGTQPAVPDGSSPLPYSVVEYRSSLKSVHQAENLPRVTLESHEARAESPSSSLSPCSLPSPLQLEPAVCMMPLVSFEEYAVNCNDPEWQDTEHSPPNRGSEGGMITHQGTAEKNGRITSGSMLITNGEGEAQTAAGPSQDSLNNNKSDVVVIDTLISSPSSLTDSTPSTSYTCSSGVTSPSGKSTDVSPEMMSTKDSSASSSITSDSRGALKDADSGLSPERQASSEEVECTGSSYQASTPEYGRGVEAECVHWFAPVCTPAAGTDVLSLARSPSSQRSPDLVTFKTPYPVDSITSKAHAARNTPTGVPRQIVPRSRSSVNKPQPMTSQTPLRRSKTSDSIPPKTPTNAGSLCDVSVVGYSASRLSLLWDDEFSAPASRTDNDSLAWEDDPYLN